MPNNKTDNKIEKERANLAQQISYLYPQLTYGEKLAVCIACGKHQATIERYCSAVKKMPTAKKIIAEMKKVLAARDLAPAAQVS